jgi:hypothetical protein
VPWNKGIPPISKSLPADAVAEKKSEATEQGEGVEENRTFVTKSRKELGTRGRQFPLYASTTQHVIYTGDFGFSV